LSILTTTMRIKRPGIARLLLTALPLTLTMTIVVSRHRLPLLTRSL